MSERAVAHSHVGLSAEELARADGSIIFAANGNSLPAAFWVVALALADPEAKERLTREIQDVLGAAACATTDIVGWVLLMLFSLMHRSHSISFTRAQGIPKYKIGLGGGKDGRDFCATHLVLSQTRTYSLSSLLTDSFSPHT
jgi:hypothetical protein